MHFTGVSKKPIKVTRHIPNSACDRSGCHTSAQTSKTISLGQPAPVKFQHGSAGHTKQLCISVTRRWCTPARPGSRPRRRTPCTRASPATTTAPRTAATVTRRPTRPRPVRRLPRPHELDRRQGRRPSPRRPADRQARAGRLRDVPHAGRRGEARRLHQLPRRPAQRAANCVDCHTIQNWTRASSRIRRRASTSPPARCRCSATPATSTGSASPRAARATAAIRRAAEDEPGPEVS